MPDANGNLTSQDEFAGKVRVRFHSYLGSKFLVLALNGHGAYLHSLSNGPRLGQTTFICDQAAGGFTLTLDDQAGGAPMIWHCPGGPKDAPDALIPLDPFHSVDPSQYVFTTYFTNACWFALNNFDGSYLAEVNGSHKAEGTAVIPHPWDGTDNQIWRAQVVT